MAQYIDKDALVAEIKQRQTLVEKRLLKNNSYSHSGEIAWERDKALYDCYNKLLSFISSLEGEEVDLEKEYKDFVEKDPVYSKLVNGIVGKAIAKHFFELGVNASNSLTWEDVKEICVQSVLVEIDLGGKVSDERHYTEVLKRFKALKGE